MNKIAGVALAAFLLCGTANAQPSHSYTGTPADAGSYPTNYDATVKAYLAETLKDPDSAKIKFVRGPRLGLFQPDIGWIAQALGAVSPSQYSWRVCYEVNAKNSYGGYTGNDAMVFLIQGGKVIRSISASDNQTMANHIEDECSQPADPEPETKTAI